MKTDSGALCAVDSSPMDADEFRRLRRAMGVKLKDLAASLGIHVNTAGLYQTGKRTIPGPVASIMRLLHANHEGTTS